MAESITNLDADVTVERAQAERTDPRSEILVLSAALLTISAALIVALPERGSSIQQSGPWLVALLALCFGMSVVTVFHVEFRREAISFSVSEVPMVFALLYLAPLPGIAARVVGSAVAFVIFRKPPMFKLVFNLSMFMFEATVAYFLVHVFIEVGEDRNAVLVTTIALSTMFASLLGSIVVSLAISRFEGSPLQRIIDEIRASWVLIINGTAAAVMLALALVSPILAIVALIPVAGTWYSLRRYGEILQRLRDLDDVYSFAGRVGRSLDLAEICRIAVDDAQRLMRSASATLVLADIGGREELHTRIDATGLHQHTAHPAPGKEFVPTETSQLLQSHEVGSLQVDGLGHRGGTIVTPVHDATGTIGSLIVDGRIGASNHFSTDDVARVRNLAEQLSSSVRKGILHRQIEFEARHDGLTGLPNRNAFERHVAEASARRDKATTLYVMMLDLDRFKEVNDTLGHSAGDELLIEFSRRIRNVVPLTAVFARLAGDEFAVLAPCSSKREVLDIARSCIHQAGRPVTLNGMSIVVTASIGVATIEHGDPEGAPMRRADIAMYNAKSTHTGIEFYRSELDRRTPARLSMLGDLRTAIECEELDVDYQPKLDLSSGMIIGAEALVRWKHAVRGIVPPSDFVRVAEDTGLIQQLTDLMLCRGIETLRNFHDRRHHLDLSVNLSTHDLLDGRLPERVAGYLSASGVDASALTLEITESSLLIDAPRTRTTINELNEIGVRLSIDDFGTGYSSLSYLRQLPVRELKIDRSFVANVLIDEQDEVIVRSTIDLGHNLGLEVVAEGVESNEVLERLKGFGCDVAQGFCISRPLPAERFIAWLNTTGHPTRRYDPLSIEEIELDHTASADVVPNESTTSER